MPSPREEVAIIGAGLSGLALALALHQQAIPCRVYENRGSPLNIGGAVMLSPNALRVLDALGVYERVRTKGYNFEWLEYRDAAGNFEEAYDFGGKEKYGYMALRIYRTDLIEEMLGMIRERGIPIEFGKKFTHIVSETEESVTWAMADGSIQTSKILIGADGIHSTVRKYLYPDLKTRFTGFVGVTAAVPTSQLELPEGYHLPATITTPNAGALVMAPQSPDGSVVFIGRQCSMPETDRAGWDKVLADSDGLVSFLQSGMEHFPQIARNAVSNIPRDTLNIWPFYIVPKLEKWASQPHTRVIILGDAAHAIPPSAGQGINQAFEDVYMFALLLAQVGTVRMEDALLFWQEYRQKRIDQIFDLNAQIDLRRMPKDQAPKVEKKEITLGWLYEPDFKKDAMDWVQAHATHT
jgi:2-polyprenyl-6-methoxyphenol hydroxylase-like FAD-dependent oxidoreductase